MDVEKGNIPLSEEVCQYECVLDATHRLPRLRVAADQLRYFLRERGLFFTLRRIMSRLVAETLGLLGLKKKAEASSPEPEVYPNEVLGLTGGELVEVRSEEEILKTLDGAAKNRGLVFTPEMREYCGRRLRVFKRVERICLEGSPGEIRLLKNTVILEGAVCNGGSRRCDRSCFFFWREAWLKRVGES
jgi:hypothetical protein